MPLFDGDEVEDTDAAVSGKPEDGESPRTQKQGEWMDADGGDAAMHAEMLGEDTAFVTILPLGGPFPPVK